MDEMKFYEGFEIMKNAQYVDMHERMMMREILHVILQKGNKHHVNIQNLIPLPFDNKNNYISPEEREFVGDFNTEWLEDYDKKMKEFEEKEENMLRNKGDLKFTEIDIKSLLKN